MLKSMLLFACLLAAMQTPQTAPYSIRVNAPLVTLDVSVSDAAGRRVTNLQKEDFEILEDQKPQALQSFSPTDAPYSIQLVIDRSRDLQDFWPLMQAAVQRFISQLKPQDRISIAAFDERSKNVQVLLDWRETRGVGTVEIPIDPVVQAPNQYTTVGTTLDIGQSSTVSLGIPKKDFFGAVQWTLERLDPTTARKGAVFFTDGRQPGSALSRGLPDEGAFSRLLTSARKSSAPLFFVAMNTDMNPRNGDFSIAALRIGMPTRLKLEQLSAGSGGRVLLPVSLEQTLAFYASIADDLGSSYTLSYAPASTAAAGTSHRIEVRVKNPALRVRQSRERYTVAK
jgi:VWFA-related protein